MDPVIARTILSEPKTVRVTTAKQIDSNPGEPLKAEISYVETVDGVEKTVSDTFTVPSAEVMTTLLLDPAGHKIDAYIAPSEQKKEDGSPEQPLCSTAVEAPAEVPVETPADQTAAA